MPNSRRSLPWSALFAALIAALPMAGCASPLPPPLRRRPDYKYLIGAGDVLNINRVWRNPELSATVRVRPDGKMTAPLIEDIVAIGKNPTALAT